MKLTNNTVLITGGTSGIGLALAVRFLKDGNRVIVCGRNPEKIAAVKAEYPELNVVTCDVSSEADRLALVEKIKADFPEINVVINNAGIQQMLDLTKLDWDKWMNELNTDLVAPIHLSGLFIPLLTGKENAQIVNVSSGLAFLPPVQKPIYGACKAGLHTFTFTLRQQLKAVGIGVTEIIPPAVNTGLGGAGLHTMGADLNEFADSVYADLGRGTEEIYFGNGRSADTPRRDLEARAAGIR